MPRLETIRAKIGATILDIFQPDWAEQIDPLTLRMENGCHCIFGQLFGSYEDGVEKVFALCNTGEKTRDGFREHLQEAATRSGFYVPAYEGDRYVETDECYKGLTKAWQREIAKRA